MSHGTPIPTHPNAITEHQQMYLDNKYARWYYNIIEFAKNRTIDGYTEKHHIIPRSLGGNDDSSNLAILTAREHFICHLLLTKMTLGNDRYKMIYALHMITNVKNIGLGRYSPTARTYDYAKKLFIEHMNTIWTAEKRAIQSKTISNVMKTSLSKLTSEELSIRMKNSACQPDSYTPERIEKARQGMLGKKKTKTPKLIEAEKNRAERIRQNAHLMGYNKGKSWKLVNGKRVYFTKEVRND